MCTISCLKGFAHAKIDGMGPVLSLKNSPELRIRGRDGYRHIKSTYVLMGWIWFVIIEFYCKKKYKQDWRLEVMQLFFIKQFYNFTILQFYYNYFHNTGNFFMEFWIMGKILFFPLFKKWKTQIIYHGCKMFLLRNV